MSEHPPYKYDRVLIENVPGDADYLDEDVTAIVRALAKYGFEISRADACRLWQLYSEEVDANWMTPGLDEDDYHWMFRCVSRYFEVRVHATSQTKRYEYVS